MAVPVICTTLLIEKSPQALPLGAACIATAIKNWPGLKDNVKVQLKAFTIEDDDFKMLDDTDKRAAFIAEKIWEIAKGRESSEGLIVCFSCFVWNVEILRWAAALLKAKGAVTIAGGPEITAHPSFYKDFDYTVSGEGEITVPLLIMQILNKSNKSNKVIISQSPDLALVHSPYLDGIIDPAEYEGALWELARGCPYKCSYCYESKGAKTVRLFPMERIKAELELFSKKKVPQVFVLDPTYNINKKRALELLRLIREKTPDTFYYFEARAELIDRELAREFTKIPCALQIGLQSANDEVLKLVNRPCDRKKFLKGISILNEEGVTFGLDLIFGLPGETFGSFRDGLDFALSLYPNNLEVFCLSVLPGTDLYDRAEGLGLIWEKDPPYHVIKNGKFSVEDMKKAEKLANACSVFYNDGRAVPWFNSVCRVLRIKGSKLFEIFYDKKLAGNSDLENCCEHFKIEKVQLDFLKGLFAERKLDRYYRAAEDIVKFYGAISRTTDTGKSETITLNYNAEYVASDYASDIKWFAENLKPQPCRIQTFKNRGEVDFRFVKK
ncbi:B12-binding domain-containing radical SAM protein [Treponema bryantii]|uniref:B12-binding domain-containing radical SAM protein n=1 Tax=Treponema bryantii TaxID=163 RepID=UPI002B2A6BD0|nr:B12-binding domain-containing radical SAM protein [Treponema bryantii]